MHMAVNTGIKAPFSQTCPNSDKETKKGWVVLVVPEVSKLESSVRRPLKIPTQFDNFAHNVPNWVMENLVSAVQLCCLAMFTRGRQVGNLHLSFYL